MNPDFLTRTRSGYDRIARAYADHFRDEFAGWYEERALLGAFADRLVAGGGGPVVDAGCGPGDVTGFLRDRGVDARGIDLSPEMVRVAREQHAGVPFAVGSLLELPTGLAGLLAWYSLIHVPPERRADCLAGFARALRPGGLLLLGFQVGTGTLHLAEALGEPVGLDFHRLDPDELADRLGDNGFTVLSRTVRAAREGERTPHAVVLARRG
ncbi:class I SAM-dependent methyltransferase [Pseudonocardia sp. C8]|uniref:class I SAM-dependent DNA methyltransferase n=1 Tax=Pseudonocardia sp. C8 TaxID=2762759 RepID=UPI001642D493|nr:class I SAM-dependent methyltransferase [Pseudonocardia sp. C8]